MFISYLTLKKQGKIYRSKEHKVINMMKEIFKKFLDKCLIAAVILIFSACLCRDKKSDEQFAENSNRPSFVAISINYRDSIYRVIVRKQRMYLKEKYQKGFKYAVKNSMTLYVDSTTFSVLKSDIVTPQYRIDSVYGGKIKNLLSVFFNEYGAVVDSLSYEEEKYLIDILFQNNIPTNIDCETGMLIISE